MLRQFFLFVFVSIILCTKSQTITADEWAAFSKTFSGSIVLPTDEKYATSYYLWSSTYDDITPEAIVYCLSEDDVQKIMEFINLHEDASFCVRVSGHSFAGFSTCEGIMIDISSLNTLELTDSGTAIVGPGVNLANFTSWAEEQDLTLPHGDCASVCFGGFLLGGGIGMTSRQFGLGADWIKTIRIVLASGELVEATDDNDYSDLFWGLRGGGGSNFGIVTQYEMNVPSKKQDNPGLYIEIIWSYNKDDWLLISSIWSKYIEQEEQFAAYLRIIPSSSLSNDYEISFHGFWTGEQAPGYVVISSILSDIDITPISSKIDYVPFEGWIEPSSSSRLRYSSVCSSRFGFDDVLSSDFFSTLADQIELIQNYEPSEVVDDDYNLPTPFMFVAPMGGAIANHDVEETAFYWRNAKYLYVLCTRYMNDYTDAEVYAKEWKANTMELLEPYLSHTSFVNFPDPELTDWQTAFYGDHYSQLQTIKTKYDPDNRFRYAQSIVPAGQPEDLNANLKRPAYYNRQNSPTSQKFTTVHINRGHLPIWAYLLIALIVCSVVFYGYKHFQKSGEKIPKYVPISQSYGKLSTYSSVI